MTMPSLFTGKFAHRSGYAYPKGPLSDESVTLAEYLQQRGYHTYGLVTNPNLDPRYKMDQGFAEYDTLKDHYQQGYPRASVVVDKAVEFLSSNPPSPFFLYLHFMDAHGPYLPPEPFDTVFTPDGVTQEDVELNKVVWRDVKEWRTKPVEERRKLLQPKRLIDLYDGELRYMDNELGRFFKTLAQRGLFSDSLIIVTADHGEEFLDHGLAAHMNAPYEELLHVPFIIKLPASLGVEANKTVSAPVSASLDVLPTILHIVDGSGVETDGENLLPLMQQETAAAKDRIVISDNHYLQVARHGPWKYIGSVISQAKARDWSDPNSSIEGELLFNLETDPGETQNLIMTHPAQATALKQHILTMIKDIPPELDDEEEVRIDPEHRRRLRALGYVE